jgi:hypothetical protein
MYVNNALSRPDISVGILPLAMLRHKKTKCLTTAGLSLSIFSLLIKLAFTNFLVNGKN